MSWVHKQMINGVNPRILLSHLMGDKFTSDEHLANLDDVSLWKVSKCKCFFFSFMHLREKPQFSKRQNLL